VLIFSALRTYVLTEASGKEGPMDITTVAQLASSVSNILMVFSVATGYYFVVRTNQGTLDEIRAQRLAGGHPTVIVSDNYNNLPEVDLVIHNMVGGPAKNTSFEFSSPVEDASGYKISDMPVFKEGLDFLSPNGEISIYWDHLDSLLPYLREKGLKRGIWVRTRYKDLAGYRYETEWHLDPFIYEHRRYVTRRTLGDLVDAVEHAVERLSSDGYEQPERTKRKGPAAEWDEGPDRP
jgi:hypothetical protein